MKEYITKHNVIYHCGCQHEIGLGIGGGFWESTGEEKNCKVHKGV